MTLDGLIDVLPVEAIESRVVWLVAGILLLALGRRLYWLFCGLVGGVFGFALGQGLAGGETGAVAVLAGLLVGAVGALAAIFFQRLAIGLAGFLVGAGLFLDWGGSALGAQDLWLWIGAVAAGLVGAFLVRALFEVALAGLSSLFGAALVVHGLALEPAAPASTAILLVLTAAGIAFQLLTRGRTKTEKSQRRGR